MRQSLYITKHKVNNIHCFPQGCGTGKFEDDSGSDILFEYGSGSGSGSGPYTCIYIYVYVYVYIFVNVYICIY
jgi:hypothetical protein